ncbi:hypothetical protein GCM10011383_04290 [Hymenobacter cavernae]|uniref:Uncharacterized protein n=2 Tax=Hymenobacter cavernae TaxID=2044852 RepID=A0ABQ1TIW6_9BACT|nr:hypothetical protein GCM10011383_04290 [Hymenobacter cavernae]
MYPMVDSVKRGSKSNHALLLKYFSATDLAYMRRQLPSVAKFEFEQTKLHLPEVKVLPFDTLTAFRERVSKQLGILADILTEYRVEDTLLKRYGSRNLYGMFCPLLSRNHKRAIIRVFWPGGHEELRVYRREGNSWRKAAVLSRIYHD